MRRFFSCLFGFLLLSGVCTPPAASQPRCVADHAKLTSLEAALQQDQACLARWCSNPQSTECLTNCTDIPQAVSALGQEISAVQQQLLTDCAAPPPPPPNSLSVQVLGAQVPLPPCTPLSEGSVSISWRFQRANSTALALLEVNPAGGLAPLPQSIQATFSPQQGIGNFVSGLSLYTAVGFSGSIEVVVQATSDSIVQLSQPFIIQGIPTSVTGFTPAAGVTPQYLLPGTLVQIQGVGFCPGLSVQFGNAYAVQPSGSLSITPTIVQAFVPPLATNGPINILQNGNLAASPQGFVVDSFRNTAAFSFKNFIPQINFSDMTQAFGFGQTYDTIDLCPPFGCNISWPDPWALVVMSIARDILGNPSGGGACYGFALGSLRLFEGQYSGLSFASTWPVPPPGNGHTFSLDSPDPHGPSGSLIAYLTAIAVSQFSNETLNVFFSQNTHSRSDVYAAVQSALLAHHPPMMLLEDFSAGLSRLSGHAVVAYNLEGSGPDSGNDYLIDVYDPNVQFLTEGACSGSENCDPSGEFHKGRVDPSRIDVAPDGTWKLTSTLDDSNSPMHGAIGGLLVSGTSLPLQPTLIGLSTIGEILVFSSASDAGTPLSSESAQISDEAGHVLFSSAHVLNTDPASKLNAVPFAPALGQATPAESFIVDGRVQRLNQTLLGTGTSSDSHILIGPNIAAQVVTKASEGLTDQLSFDANGAVSFTTHSPGKPVSLRLMKRLSGDLIAAELDVAASQNAEESVRFDQATGDVVLRHGGASTTLRLKIGATRAASLPSAFDTGTLRVNSNETLTFHAAKWETLNAVTITEVDAQGNKTSRLVQNARTQSSLGRVVSVSARKGTEAIDVSSEIETLPANSTVGIVWRILRGGQIVDRGSATIPESELVSGTRHDRIQLHPLQPGSYDVQLDMVVVAMDGWTPIVGRDRILANVELQ
jgi:hypothetical protein